MKSIHPTRRTRSFPYEVKISVPLVETALNSSSDLLLSISAELRQWRLSGKKLDMKELCK